MLASQKLISTEIQLKANRIVRFEPLHAVALNCFDVIEARLLELRVPMALEFPKLLSAMSAQVATLPVESLLVLSLSVCLLPRRP